MFATERKSVNHINHSHNFNSKQRDLKRMKKANDVVREAITRGESQMTYDNEAIVRNAYHTAEGNVLNIPGWIGSFTEDGVFNNVSGEASYRGEHLKDVVITFAKMFPDVHRELYRVNVMGDVVAIELAIQGTFRGPMETPAGVIQPTGAKVDIPCADFFYMRNGKI